MIEFLPFEVASGKNVPDSAAGVKGGIATPKSGVVPKADFAESSRNDGVGALAMAGGYRRRMPEIMTVVAVSVPRVTASVRSDA